MGKFTWKKSHYKLLRSCIIKCRNKLKCLSLSATFTPGLILAGKVGPRPLQVPPYRFPTISYTLDILLYKVELYRFHPLGSTLFAPPQFQHYSFYPICLTLQIPPHRIVSVDLTLQVPLYRFPLTGFTLQLVSPKFHPTGSTLLAPPYRLQPTGSTLKVSTLKGSTKQVAPCRFNPTGSTLQAPSYRLHKIGCTLQI